MFPVALTTPEVYKLSKIPTVVKLENVTLEDNVLPVNKLALTLMLPEMPVMLLPSPYKYAALTFPEALRAATFSVSVNTRALSGPKVSTALALPAPRLGSASPNPKNSYLVGSSSSYGTTGARQQESLVVFIP